MTAADDLHYNKMLDRRDEQAYFRRSDRAALTAPVLAVRKPKPGKPRPVADLDVVAAARLYRSGVSSNEIARRTGCHKGSVLRALVRYGVEIRDASQASVARYAA